MRAEPPTIRQPFSPRLRSPDDLAAAVGVDVDILVESANRSQALYTLILLPKPNGTMREIRPPSRPLRAIQRKLLRAFEQKIHYPRWMMGAVPDRSIFRHARLHVGSGMVATFDLKDFFPSTSEGKVISVLEALGLSETALEIAVKLVTWNGHLPQGAPSSPFFANLSLDRTDRRIDALCRRKGLRFSRYVDDIAISGDCNLRQYKGSILQFVEDGGFNVAREKIQFMGRNRPQIVTKLVVNDKLRPTTAFMREVGDTIRKCLEAGPATVADELGLTVHQLKRRLTGRVSHISQASPEHGKRLRGKLCGVAWSSRIATLVIE